MLLNPFRFGAAPPGGTTFYDLVMAESPVHYWRNAEASGGSVMVDEIAADGAYAGSLVTLGAAALYPGAGALSSAELNVGGSGNARGYSLVVPPALTSMTLLTVMRPIILSGFRLVGVQRDENGSGRKYQWRTNGTTMEFVKIVGGVATVAATIPLAINNVYFLAFVVDASGNYKFNVNGTPAGSGNIGGTDYGGAGDPWSCGYADGPACNFGGRLGENVVINRALSDATLSSLFAATGL